MNKEPFKIEGYTIWATSFEDAQEQLKRMKEQLPYT